MALSKVGMSEAISSNSEEFPMNENDKLEIEVKDEVIARKYPFDSSKRGKWMLFVPIKHIDDLWQRALRLYRAGELTGIISIKTSTAVANPWTEELEEGAVRFACGPSDDEDLVLAYGRNVVTKMGYYSERGSIAYKTDQQTAKGTRYMGEKRNSIYRIAIPTKNPTIEKNKNNNNYKKIELPSRTSSKLWLYEIEDDIALQYQLDLYKLGGWSLTFPKRSLDAERVKACKLYRKNELTGVSYLKVSTAKPTPVSAYTPSGVIIFFCVPDEGEDAITKYGRNLVQKMCYSNSFNNLRFTVQTTPGALQILYELDLLTC